MLSRLLFLPLLLAAVGTATAQTPEAPTPSPQEMSAIMAMARQAMNPAAAVLANREALRLTPAQVAALDSLATPMNAFVEERITRQMEPSEAMRAMMDPTAEIDEAAIRAAYREQADQQADLMIRMARMERAGKKSHTIQRELPVGRSRRGLASHQASAFAATPCHDASGRGLNHA